MLMSFFLLPTDTIPADYQDFSAQNTNWVKELSSAENMYKRNRAA